MNNNLSNLESTTLSNSSKIEENKGNISSNLINMRLNEDNIAINLSKIKKLDQNKSYLKIFMILYFMIQKLKLILEIFNMKKYLLLMLNRMILLK